MQVQVLVGRLVVLVERAPVVESLEVALVEPLEAAFVEEAAVAEEAAVVEDAVEEDVNSNSRAMSFSWVPLLYSFMRF